MRSLSALRALARVELRESRRQLGRSTLVALLVAVPVAAMVGGSALFQITRATPDEQRAQMLGRATLRVELRPEEDVQRLRELLPPEARVEPLARGREEVRAHGRALVVETVALDVAGLAAGMLRVTEGRAPMDMGDVALSPTLIDELGLAVGDVVETSSGPASITGIAFEPERLDARFVLRAADAATLAGARAWLVDLPADELSACATRLRASGLRVTLRAELGERDAFESLVIFVLGGFAFFEAALVIAAAFAVSLRRRQREIGLLGATGASAGDLRTAWIASTLVLASIGVAFGVVLGCAAAGALLPFLDRWNERLNGAFELSLVHVLGAVALGLVAAIAAVVLPACSATRLSIRVALGGRRPVTGGSSAWLALGVALIVAGFGSMAWGTRASGSTAGTAILGGSMLGVLGLGACSPWILATLARFASPLPLAWRLAVRDAGRYSGRNGPVVTAVLAGMSVSVMLAAVIDSLDALPGAAGAEHGLVDLILLLCFVTGLIVVFVATALSSAESAADARVLHAVGAAPDTMRAHAASRAAYLALLGCALAIPAGLLPSYGVLALANVELEFAMPWLRVLIVCVGLPGLAYAGAWSFSALHVATPSARPSSS